MDNLGPFVECFCTSWRWLLVDQPEALSFCLSSSATANPFSHARFRSIRRKLLMAPPVIPSGLAVAPGSSIRYTPGASFLAPSV